MSTEWTVVTRNKRNTKVVQKQHEVQQSNAFKSSRLTMQEKIQRENEKREQWEKRRQKKIDEYNAEYPLLPGGKDSVSDAKKIAYIDAKRANKKEADHKAYLERETRRQAKAKRDAERARIAEEEHVKDMIEKWGSHRWYRCVAYTEDDCDTADRLRYEENEREEEREWRMEQLQREYELEWEKKEAIRKAEREKYIAEQTANMSEQEKLRWIIDFEYDEEIELDHAFQAEGEIWYQSYLKMEKEEREDKERLDRWNAKHGKK